MRFLEEAMEGLVENRTTNDVLNLFKEMKAEFIRYIYHYLWIKNFIKKNVARRFLWILFYRIKLHQYRDVNGFIEIWSWLQNNSSRVQYDE
jgi:hypothetical protein